MTEKRFKLIEESDWWGVTDNQLPKTEYGFREDLPNGYLSCDYEYNDLTPQEVVDLLNELNEENEELKQQLLYDGDGVCDICKHEYLTPSGDYFISNCRKGHEECSKEDLRYCKDFEVKELEND